MQPASAHVDGLDLGRRSRLDGVVVAFANGEVVLDDPPEGREGQDHLAQRTVALGANVEHEAIFLDAKMEAVRSAVVADGGEAILLDQVEDGDGALMLDFGAAPD